MSGRLPVRALLVLMALCMACEPALRAPAGHNTRTHGRSVPLPTGGEVPGRPIAPPAAWVRAVRVVDGDTLIVRAHGGSTSVRLIGVDAPELGPRDLPGAVPDAVPDVHRGPRGCGGRAARRALSRLVRPGDLLHVSTDRERHDRYGRSLLYVWTARGLFVNAALIRSGHARAMVIPPNDRFAGVFREAEVTARRAPRGRRFACAGASGRLPPLPRTGTPND